MSHSRQILTNTCAGQDRTFPNADISLMRRRTKTGINSDNESLWMGVLNIAQYVRQIEGMYRIIQSSIYRIRSDTRTVQLMTDQGSKAISGNTVASDT